MSRKRKALFISQQYNNNSLKSGTIWQGYTAQYNETGCGAATLSYPSISPVFISWTKADPHEAKSKYKRMLQFVKKPKDGLTISIGDTIRTADTCQEMSSNSGLVGSGGKQSLLHVNSCSEVGFPSFVQLLPAFLLERQLELTSHGEQELCEPQINLLVMTGLND